MHVLPHWGRSCRSNLLSHQVSILQPVPALTLSRQPLDRVATWVQISKFTGIFLSCRILSYLSRSLADRWGTTVDFTTSFLHSSPFSACRRMVIHWRPVHSFMLSSHRFLCLPLGLPLWTVPCRIVLTRHARTTSHFSEKTGGLYTARWCFQIWYDSNKK